MKVDLCFDGGGTRGLAHIGALSSLASRGFTPARVAGTSAGAIIATLIAAGYSPKELKSIMMDLDFTKFQDGSRWKIKKSWDLISKLGIYKGKAFEDWIKKLLKEKGIETFGDLTISGERDLRWRWKLKVIVSDITNKKMIVLPDEAKSFGIDPDDFSVAKAVRASMSIPFYFRPVSMNKNYWIDGGLLSTYAIWIFDSDKEPRFPTFGLLLQEDDKGKKPTIDEKGIFKRTFRFGRDLIETMIKAHDKRFVTPGDYAQRTIIIPTGDVGTTEFDLSMNRKIELYNSGVSAADNFLSSWNWEDYKAWAIRTRRRG